MAEIHDRQVITVAGTAPNDVVLAAGARTRTVDGVTVRLHGQARAGETSDLSFSFADGADSAPIRDLQPYLAAAGHVVIMRGDGATFAHEHAEVRDGSGNPVFAVPGQTFGPVLPVRATFDTPGIYQLWGQFRLADDRVITVPFTVRAA
jgi:Cu+-exporting ATPase